MKQAFIAHWRRIFSMAAILLGPGLASAEPQSLSGMAVEYAGGEDDDVSMLRLSGQADMNRRWFQRNGRHLAAYWDVSLARWRTKAWNSTPGEHKSVTTVGLTPVFRYRSDSGLGWYAEGGIGLQYFSDAYYNGDKQLATRFQFGDHLGAGYVFANGWDVGARFQHFSNGGLKKPNDGVNLLILRASRHF
jgi:hypothetical protein